MKRLVSTCLIISLFVSCGTKNKRRDGNSTEPIIVKIDPRSREVINMSDFIDSVKYVKLELTDNSLIKNVSKIFEAGDKIIIVDYSAHEIFVFSSGGKFLSKVSRRGRGPGEYIRIQNVMYDALNDNLIVYAGAPYWKMIHYTLEGSVVKEISSFDEPRSARDIINLPNGNFLCYDFLAMEKGDFGLWETDSEGKFVRWVLKQKEFHPTVAGYDTFLYRLPDNKVGFMYMTSEDTFIYENDSLRKCISYEVNGKTAKDYYGVNNNDFAEHFMNGVFFNVRLNSSDKGKYVFTKWLDETMFPYYTLVDKEKGSVRVGRTLNVELPDGTTILGANENRKYDVIEYDMVNNDIENTMIIPVYAGAILDALEDENISEKTKQDLKKLTDEMTARQIEEMNPVLQILYVKK